MTLTTKSTIGKRRPIKSASPVARLTVEQKSLFQRAAEIEGRSTSDFVLAAAQREATRTLELQHIVALSARDSRVFAAAILDPPAPNRVLRQAAHWYRKINER